MSRILIKEAVLTNMTHQFGNLLLYVPKVKSTECIKVTGLCCEALSLCDELNHSDPPMGRVLVSTIA